MREHTGTPDGWAFAKELSDALIKIRPLGGSELFVNRNGQYYADPAYCGAAIDASHKRHHRTMENNDRLQRRVDALEKALTDLLEMCLSAGDFKNGVTHNCIDEGEVYASGIFDQARQTLRDHAGGGA